MGSLILNKIISVGFPYLIDLYLFPGTRDKKEMMRIKVECEGMWKRVKGEYL
jgi:hypothetical protein